MHLSTDFYDGMVDSGLIAGNVKITMPFPVWNENAIRFLRHSKRLNGDFCSIDGMSRIRKQVKELRGNVNYLPKQS